MTPLEKKRRKVKNTDRDGGTETSRDEALTRRKMKNTVNYI